MIVLRPFLIPRCQPPKLLEAVDQPLDAVALPIQHAVERTGAPFIGPAWDRIAHAPLPQVRPNLPAAIALVTDDTPGPQLGPTRQTAF